MLFSLRQIWKVYIQLLKSVYEMSWLSSFVFHRSGGISQWRYAHRTVERHYPHRIWRGILKLRINYSHMIFIPLKHHFKVFAFDERWNVIYIFMILLSILILHVFVIYPLPHIVKSSLCVNVKIFWQLYSSVKPSIAECWKVWTTFSVFCLFFCTKMKKKNDKCYLLESGNKHEYKWVKTAHGTIWESNSVCLLEMTYSDIKFMKDLSKLCKNTNNKIRTLSEQGNYQSF